MSTPTQPTRDHCIHTAAVAYLDALARQDARTPREAALAAWTPDGPSVDELEQRILADRAQRSRPNRQHHVGRQAA